MTVDGLPSISSLGDAAIVVTFGDSIDPETHQRVMAFAAHLDSSRPPAMVEYIPAFTTVTVIYDPLATTCDEFIAMIQGVVDEATPAAPSDETTPIDIPVCYGGDFGPDLDFVASHDDLTPDEVVEIHSAGTYVVCMIGFAPGFPYLGGMSHRIAAPRLDSPRARVPVGSVGIAGVQTGIYSMETPGGWRLIGRTPRALFRPTTRTPSLLQAGDRVRFVRIGRDEFDTFEEEATS